MIVSKIANYLTLLTDEKIAEIVTQLGMANAEKDELVVANKDKDKIIKELTEKVAAMQNRKGFLFSYT